VTSRPDFAHAIAAAARSIHHTQSLDETLQAIAYVARDSVPGFDHVGISTVQRNGKVETRAATGHLVYELDNLQYSLNEGPCVETLRDAHVVVAPQIRHDQRWPRFVPPAVGLGLRSQLAVRLYVDKEGVLGGLNLYSTTSDDVDAEAESIAELFAVHAAIALNNAHERETLNQALESRKVIGQAIGMIMERYDMSEDRAFAFLVRASSHSNLKLRDIAQELVDQRNTN
jgi:GAF domain-containing protein